MASRESSDLQLLEVSRRARKLTHMVNSWFKVANLDGGSNYISNGLLQDALDLQQSLNMSGKLRSAKMTPHMNLSRREREPMEGALIRNNYSSRLQEEKLCSSHSWRGYSEELKKVIRDSLYGQNLLQNSSDDEKESSNRSLEFYGRSGGLDSSYYEAEGRRKQSTKMKSPNLIAKLMGLEEVPAEAAATIKKEQNGKNLNAPRSMLHVEVPEARRLLLLEQIPRPERVTLQSMIEREKIEQQLVKRDLEVRCRHQPHSSGTSANEQEQDTKKFYGDEEEAGSFSKAMQLYFWQQRGEEKEDLKREDVIANNGQALAYESVRKEAMSSKKSKGELSKKSKMPASVCHGQQKKESAKSLMKRTDEGQRSALNRVNPQREKDVKVPANPLSQAKKATTKSTEPATRRAASKSIVTRAGEPQQNGTIPQRKLVPRNSTNPAAEKKTSGAKPVQKTTKLKTTTQKDGKETSPSKTDDASAISILPAAEAPKQKKLSPKSSNSEQTRKDQKIICEVMPKANKGGMSPGKEEAAAAKHVDNELSATKRADKVDHLEGLLLSCQSFLFHAYELSLDAHAPLHRRKMGPNKVDRDDEIYLACAEELLARKRCNLELSSHPVLVYYSWSWRQYASVDEVVGEISKGIRRLANYSEIGDDVTSKDSLYVRLERDLKCKDVLLNAMWDLGWRNAVCKEEADHVVGQVEEQIISAIIEEEAMELVSYNFVNYYPL